MNRTTRGKRHIEKKTKSDVKLVLTEKYSFLKTFIISLKQNISRFFLSYVQYTNLQFPLLQIHIFEKKPKASLGDHPWRNSGWMGVHAQAAVQKFSGTTNAFSLGNITITAVVRACIKWNPCSCFQSSLLCGDFLAFNLKQTTFLLTNPRIRSTCKTGTEHCEQLLKSII